MRAMGIVIAVLFLGLPAFAQEKPTKPDTPAEAAEKVLAAFEAEDEAALRVLAEKDDPDPWLTADRLARGGEQEAAIAFAAAVAGKENEGLAAYVASLGEGQTGIDAVEQLMDAEGALSRGEAEEAMEMLYGKPPDATPVLRVLRLVAIGRALQGMARQSDSRAAFEEAAALAVEIRWIRKAIMVLWNAGTRAIAAAEFDTVVSIFERQLALAERSGRPERVAFALANLGSAFQYKGDLQRALTMYERALELVGEGGDPVRRAKILFNIGVTLLRLGQPEGALSHAQRAVKDFEALDDQFAAATAVGFVGICLEKRGELVPALDHYRRAIGLYKACGRRDGLPRVLMNLGNVQTLLEDHASALQTYQDGLELAEELGLEGDKALLLGGIGLAYARMGEFRQGLAWVERSFALDERSKNSRAIATDLHNLGSIHHSLGEYAFALSFHERALNLWTRLRDPRQIALTLMNIGSTFQYLGEFGRALDHYDRALRTARSGGLMDLEASLLASKGAVKAQTGEQEAALALLEEACESFDQANDRRGLALALSNLGTLCQERGDLKKAREVVERALSLHQEVGDRAGASLCLAVLGGVLLAEGHTDRGIALLEEAADSAGETGASWVEMNALGSLALTLLRENQLEEALSASRRGVRVLGSSARGLAQEQSIRAREGFSGVFEAGLQAAARLSRPEDVCYFLESGRAGSLLEFLGGREKLQAFLVPESLRMELARGRGAESVASHRLTRALETGSRKEIRQHRLSLEEARGRVREVIQRVQREAKAAAEVLYPEAASLEEIISNIEEGEALVLYGLTEPRALALVVTQDKGRIVSLGETAKVREAIGAVSLTDLEEDPSRALTELRDLVVTPLGLGPETKRLLVSPHGVLSEVPFSLITDREVAYLPSGTTYAVLLDERAKEGKGVLALGDPDYGAAADPRALAAYHRGGKLTPLPATRAEAKGVGDVLLLGKDATEAGLVEAVGKRPRWRAVHLACHGVIDTERPTLSSLAITPDPENDGFLTCLEVFRMKIPADLVVLSACETAKGKVYKAEGIVGLTRAFMMAGAPRVICSLWKVDDEATKALMVKFYELWNPKEGEGLPAATALKQAQEFVKSHEKWKHPYYWAAWVLWGLAE